MGWKKELGMRFDAVEEHLASIDQRLNTFLEWIIPLTTQVKMLRERVEDQNGKLTDKLVEMAMVKAGDTQAAVAHRGQLRLEKVPDRVETREWSEGDGGQEWPPDDADTMEIN